MSKLKDYILNKTTILNRNLVEELDNADSPTPTPTSDFTVEKVTFLRSSLINGTLELQVATAPEISAATLPAIQMSSDSLELDVILYKGRAIVYAYANGQLNVTGENVSEGRYITGPGEVTISPSIT